MTELRDARLKRALDAAPDAAGGPDARTRQAILERARGAVRPDSHWWDKWWGAGGERVPWTAALATVVMATLVTLLWHDREIPGPRPDTAPVEAPVAAPPPAPATSPAPASVPTPAPAAAPAPAPAAPAARKSEVARSSPPAAQRSEPTRALRDQVAPAPAAGATAKGVPQPAESRAAADAEMAAAAPPPPPAPAAAARARAPAATGLASPMRRPVGEAAMQLRIAGPAGSVDRPLAPSSRLEQLLQQAIASATGAEPLAQPADIGVELRRDGEPLGLLELAGPQVRWTPARGEAGGTARPDAASLRALREELGQLLQR